MFDRLWAMSSRTPIPVEVGLIQLKNCLVNLPHSIVAVLSNTQKVTFQSKGRSGMLNGSRPFKISLSSYYTRIQIDQMYRLGIKVLPTVPRTWGGPGWKAGEERSLL